MTSPALGIAYSLWLRLRWALVGMLAYLAILAVAVQLSSVAAPYFMMSLMALTFAIAHLLNVFTFGPADLGGRGSGFPANMFVLPLPTRSLVGWPMLYGAATHAGLWILVATLILIPGGLPAPILWPAALLAACTAWVQAIGWSPFPSPFVRVPALTLALAPLILLGAWSGTYLESSHVSILVASSSVIWTAAAYAFAVQGLSRARGGSDGDWFRAFADRRAASNRRKHAARRPAFRTAATAQLWHEFRRNGLFLPLMVSFAAVPMLPLVCQTVVNDDNNNPGVMIGSTVLSPMALALTILIAIPVLLSGLFGTGMGKFDFFGKVQIPPFLATRPMATTQFIVIKIKAAAISAAMVWALMVALLAVWATVEASPLNPRQSLVRAAIASSTLRDFAAVDAIALASFAFIWRDILLGMWTTLAGRKWVSNTVGLASLTLVSRP